MRSTLFAGFATLALIAAAAPAMAAGPQTGGVSITRGGGNVNTAVGRHSDAEQSIATVGGSAFGRGLSVTNGGNNRNSALGARSQALQDVTTTGDIAAGRGRVFTN